MKIDSEGLTIFYLLYIYLPYKYYIIFYLTTLLPMN